MDTNNVGVFYSVNSKLLCFNIKLKNPRCTILEPFVGIGSLLDNFTGYKDLELYDIDSPITVYKDYIITKRDTINDPPIFTGKTVITNPPYLALNKMDASVKEKYINLMKKNKVDDIYKIFIAQLCSNLADECILVLPFSFMFSIRVADINLREKFLRTYKILYINLFLDQIFEDTTTNVLVIHAIHSPNDNENYTIPCSMINISLKKLEITSETKTNLTLSKENLYLPGGEIYSLRGKSTVGRYTSKTPSNLFKTNIKAICIDNVKDKIRLEYSDTITEGKESDRTTCFIVSSRTLSTDEQHYIIQEFNELLGGFRNKYHSLFMNNYRDKNRKRIAFDLVFNLISYVIDQMDNTKNLVLFDGENIK